MTEEARAEKVAESAAQPAPNVAYASFSAEINQVTTEQLLGYTANLTQQQPAVSELHLALSSVGGSVINGLTIYNVLRAMPYKVVTYNVGAVNSIANVVFLAGEERYASEVSSFMFHGVGFDTPANTRFEEKDLRERLQSVQTDQALIGAIINTRTSINAEETDRLFLEAETKSVEYALQNNIIHAVRDFAVPKGMCVAQFVFQR